VTIVSPFLCEESGRPPGRWRADLEYHAPMKTHLYVAVLLGALVAMGCDTTEKALTATAEPSATASAVSIDGAPTITVAEKVFEFGKVKLGSTVEHTFKLRNEGSAPLIIERAKGS